MFAFSILDLLNNLAVNCDINMVVNVSAFSSTTSTYGRVHLVPPGYDALCRYVRSRMSNEKTSLSHLVGRIYFKSKNVK